MNKNLEVLSKRAVSIDRVVNNDGSITLNSFDSNGVKRISVTFIEGGHKIDFSNYNCAGRRCGGINSYTLRNHRARCVMDGQQILVNEVIYQLDRLYRGMPFNTAGSYNHRLAHQFWGYSKNNCVLADGEVFGVCAGEVCSNAQNLKHKVLVEQIYNDTGIIVSMPATSQLLTKLATVQVITKNDLVNAGVNYNIHTDSSGIDWVEFLG